jgi:hypothetical protein
MTDNGQVDEPTEEEVAITVDMIRPFLTDRGSIEISYAIEAFRARVLAAKVENLEAKLRQVE